LLLTSTGVTGVDPGFGISIPSVRNVATTVLDGQQFTIRRGDGREQLFEMTTDNFVTQGAIPVFFVSNSSPGVLAESIAQAIRTATLDLLPVVDPTGVVLLPNAADVSLLLGNSVFTQVGRSGQTASIRIPLPLNATTLEWTVALETAIDAQNIAGVITQVVGNRILVGGTRAVSGTGSVLLTAPSDLAGNRLAGNPNSGRAEFEVRLSTGLDYGDAPNVSSSSVNGPTHQIADGLSLGPTVTPDANAPTTDLDDGVVFASANRIFAGTGLGYTVNVRNLDPTRAVVLNAWFDWNGNGVFETGGREHVVINAPVNAGNNSLSALVPLDATRGAIQARFRLSSQAGLGPMGPAVDGEVEDYSITVQSNPFQNGVNSLDVNRDGRVSPVDALLVINKLNTGNVILDFNTAADPPVPPFWDVTGNGRVEPSDVLPIINFLNGLAQAEPTAFGVAAPGVLAPVAQIAHDTRTPEVDLTIAHEIRTTALVQASGEPQEDYSDLAFSWNDRDDEQSTGETHSDLDTFFASLN
jgi:hypothetical protein